MDAGQATQEIKSVFSTYHTLSKADRTKISALNAGKLYELWVLSRLITEIDARGYTIAFKGSNLTFKGAPGYLKVTDPHFTINGPGLPRDKYRIFVDVEFTTLSAMHRSATLPDRSAYYEADIIVTRSTRPRPTPHETAIVIECKAHANLAKGVVREILGTRRELSLLRLGHSYPCDLPDIANPSSPLRLVPATPSVDLRLVTTDPKAVRYRQGPDFFGINIEDACP